MNIQSIYCVLIGMLSAQVACAQVPSKITGLKMPESVIQAKDGRVFVSEIGGFGQDGDGQITVINTKGQASVFAKGMDDPKGLAIIGDDLYVADKTRILKVTANGEWTVFVPASAFTRTPDFLNDLATDAAGNLYVSDSGDLKGGGGSIYKINTQGAVQVLINTQADARVLGPNGLLIDGQDLIWVDFASGILYRLEMTTLKMTEIAQGFGGGDGIVKLANGDWVVSDWKNGKVMRVSQGKVKLIQDGFQSAADIELSQDGQYVMVPDMKAGELHFIQP